MLQAWTEQNSRAKLSAHDAWLLAQHERLESEWEARWSVAGTPATADAVALMNDRERKNFQWQASEQRQQVIAQTVWDMRQLLCWQQQALARLHVPGFTDEGITSMVDEESLTLQSQICQYLHSAFYIRHRMGSEPHETMLRSQLKKLLREQESGGSHSPKMMATKYPPGTQVPPPYHIPLPPLPPLGSYQAITMPPMQQQPQSNFAYSSQQMYPQPPVMYNHPAPQHYHQQSPDQLYGPAHSQPQQQMQQQQQQQQQLQQHMQPMHASYPPSQNSLAQPPPYNGATPYPYYQPQQQP
jgi:hypothetical protein